jgi:hypothetical protein
MTPRTDPEQLLSEPSSTLRHRETTATPKPPPEPEPPPVDRPNSKPVATRLLTATCGGDSLNGPQAQHRQINLPASGVYRKIYVPAQDPNPRSDRKPDSVEEGDRIINPKAPPTLRTPPTTVPISDVTIVVTRVGGLFRDVAVPISIGQREYNIGQCEYGIDFGELTGAVESPSCGETGVSGGHKRERDVRKETCRKKIKTYCGGRQIGRASRTSVKLRRHKLIKSQ